VGKASQNLGFGKEGIDRLIGERSVQHFEGHPTLQIDVLGQVHLCEAASSQQAQEAIVAKLLTGAIGHDADSLK
jgi:hypothetical protein